MPRNQGTSRKGKPGKHERAVGLGLTLKRAQASSQKYQPRTNGKSRSGDGGMARQPGVESVGQDPQIAYEHATRSVLELQDIDDFLQQADLANREFVSEKEGLVVLDATGYAYRGPSQVTWASDHPDGKDDDNFVFKELSVPRRPAWDESTTRTELERNERQAFLEWRRAIAKKEEQLFRSSSSSSSNNTMGGLGGISVTPFEKNLEVWRQLWRVLERSDCLLQLVDARNPLFYLSDDLKEYSESLGKPMMVLINKSDHLSRQQRKVWHEYLKNQGWDTIVFFSAIQEQAKLDAAAQEQRRRDRIADLANNDTIRNNMNDEDDNWDDKDDEEDKYDDEENEDEYGGKKPKEEESDDKHHHEQVDSAHKDKSPIHPEEEEEEDEEHANDTSSDGCGVDAPLTREQLIEAMMEFAAKHGCKPTDLTPSNATAENHRIQFGMVGFPNVGKSSVINVLVGSSKHTHGLVRVAVAAQPGKTKHFQTLLLPDRDDMMLCDCPGLVFPSFVSNTADLIAAGVYPIAQMRDHWPVINLICQRIPREIINAQYGIQLPIPTDIELKERGFTQLPPPTADEFLTTYCVARSFMAASSGAPDYQRAARIVIKDYANGKLLFCHPPPNVDKVEFFRETVATALKNAEKLRMKLIVHQHKKEVYSELAEQEENEEETDMSVIDDDMLDILGGTPADATSKSAKKKDGKQKAKKWGKKNRKLRDKDPYGCHSTPDDSLKESVVSHGLTVKAGKHGITGYTRPNGYGVVRFAADASN